MALAHQGGFITSRTLVTTETMLVTVSSASGSQQSAHQTGASGWVRKFQEVPEYGRNTPPPDHHGVFVQQTPLLLGRELVNGKGVFRVPGLTPVPRLGVFITNKYLDILLYRSIWKRGAGRG